jgi:peptidoglycan hydrolase-like protein with peptidoglycan-binding domain
MVNEPACLTISSNLRYGADDAYTQGQVTQLQQVLVSQGFFDSSLIGSGHFGPVTLRAVISFQNAHSLPTTGYVGPMTRGVIASLNGSCQNPVPPQSNVSLYNLNPQSSVTGATVSVTGFGFTSANTILMDGSVAAQNVPITSSIAIACTTSPLCHGGINQTLTFTVPSSLAPYCAPGFACAMYMRLVTPAQYNITVMNANGTSNALPLTITSGTTGVNPLSISRYLDRACEHA